MSLRGVLAVSPVGAVRPSEYAPVFNVNALTSLVLVMVTRVPAMYAGNEMVNAANVADGSMIICELLTVTVLPDVG